MDSVSKLKWVAEIILFITYALILLSVVCRIAFFSEKKYNDFITYSNQAFSTLLFIVYMVIVCRLRREIHSLQGMSEERKQIWLQSIVILISFLLQTVVSSVWTLYKEDVITLSEISTILIRSLDHFLQKCMVPFLIMLAHHRSFKSEKELHMKFYRRTAPLAKRGSTQLDSTRFV